jgi:hypothetical protein
MQHQFMNEESPSLLDFQIAFNSKMNAAKFFFDKIKDLNISNLNITNVPDELYYYADATIFEFFAASQMFLQIINIKLGITDKLHKVRWNPEFQNALKNKNEIIFNWWEVFYTSIEFCQIKGMREYISHKGGTLLIFAYDHDQNDKVIAVTIPRFKYNKKNMEVLPTGKSIELLDELVEAANFLNMKFLELGKF